MQTFLVRMLLVLSGVFLLCLAMPGSGSLWPLAFIGLVPLLFVFEGGIGHGRGKYVLGAGLLYYGTLVHWLAGVFATYAGLPAVLGWLAVAGLALYMSLYLLIFAFGMHLLRGSPNLLLWGLPALWVGLDWLRGYVLTGFPWMDLGYVLAFSPKWIQIADLVGHHGLSFFIVQINVLFYLFIKYFLEKRGRELVRIAPSFAVIVFLIGSSTWYSLHRYEEVSEQAQTLPQADIIVVQGNIDQSKKWSPENRDYTIRKYLDLTVNGLSGKRADLVVWPETALPFYPTNTASLSLALERAATIGDFALLTGAPWYEQTGVQSFVYYNSAQLLTPESGFSQSYYKSHLVPFGEYVPFRKFLPFLEPLVESVGDFSPGRVEKPLSYNGIKAGVLVCFESVFPGIAKKWSQEGANLLVNLTNDAWYGRSSAPYHSLAMSVMRAVETRRDLVRAANTGVSALVGANGTLIKDSDIFVDWVGRASLALRTEKTIYVAGGHLFAPLCLLFASLLLFYRRVKGVKGRQKNIS